MACQAVESAPGSDGFGFGGSSPGDSIDLPTDELPPELELEASFRAPVVTGSYVWSANPDSNRVALVDARTFAIQVFDGGHRPTFLAALPEGPTRGGALIINELSHDASVFLFADEAKTASAVEASRVPLDEGANAWAVSSDGRFALAWSRLELDAKEGTTGLQDLTVISFESGSHTASLSVGYRPSAISLSDSGERAVIVSDPGLTLVRLGGATIAEVEREIFLPEGSGQRRDVSVTRDGRFAFARVDGSRIVALLDLDTGSFEEVTLPEVVTDLDLSESGTVGVFVMRGDAAGSTQGEGGHGGASEDEQPSRFGVFDPETWITDATAYQIHTAPTRVGSVSLSPLGETAVLYSTAADVSTVVLFDTASEGTKVHDLRSKTRAVLLSPDSETALAILDRYPGSQNEGGFATIPIQKSLPVRIEGTALPPTFVSFAPDSQAALITTKGASGSDKAAEVFVLQLPSFSVSSMALPSVPLASGIVRKAERGFVSQMHNEGRITFVDLDGSGEKTVTGFELSQKVVDR